LSELLEGGREAAREAALEGVEQVKERINAVRWIGKQVISKGLAIPADADRSLD
jgi:hypothetical protein